MLRTLESEAERVAERELRRRQAVFASLSPGDRETLDAVAHRVAMHVVSCLVAEARCDERLARALGGGERPLQPRRQGASAG